MNVHTEDVKRVITVLVLVLALPVAAVLILGMAEHVLNARVVYALLPVIVIRVMLMMMGIATLAAQNLTLVMVVLVILARSFSVHQ
eukprot:UN17401